MRFTLFALLGSLLLALAACGVADPGASAAGAKLQAEQARQAKETADRITQQIDANKLAAEQRLAAIAEESAKAAR